MITCSLRYVINPSRRVEFEAYGRLWIGLVRKYGGMHHGFFLPFEEEDNVALAVYSFSSADNYAVYLSATLTDPECIEACAYAARTGCIVRVERDFLRLVETNAD
ncbi:MAG: NIPSNAP family protein [Burkholderiaceae bacterium]